MAETTSAWTGEKREKIPGTTPAPGDFGKVARDDSEDSDEAAHAIDHEQDWLKQIEGFNWTELEEATDHYLKQLDHVPPEYDDLRIWGSPNEQQLEEMNIRLALCRIRAQEGALLKGLDEEQLREKYPPKTLLKEGYYVWCERTFEWYFDPESFRYVGLQDYQRLRLRSEMSLGDAVEQLNHKGVPAIVSVQSEFELRKDLLFPGPVTRNYNAYVAHIDEKVPEGEARRLIIEDVK